MSGRYDAIVVGGGSNGLAAAVRLARGRRRVVVVERRSFLGGLCAAREFHPGFVAPGIRFDDGLLRPAIARRLGLERHGLRFDEPPPVLVAEANGPGLLLDRDPRRAAVELAARSPRDAEAYAAYRRFANELAPLLDALLGAPPPPLAAAGWREHLAQFASAGRLLRFGRRRATELARVAPMCAADFLNERFETPLLVEALAAPAVASTFSGPWSAGTATHLLLRAAAPGRPVAGGPPALIAALEAAARAAGVELRTDAEVTRIRVERGAVAGVELAGGDSIEAPCVLASCDPKRALLDLLPPGSLPVAVEDEIRNVRARGTAALLHLALSAPLALTARPGERFAAIRLGGGHVDELERAFDALKYRLWSPRPQLEIRVPTVAEPALAPPGGEVVSILASFAPYTLEGGWTEAERDALRAAILERLESVAPGVGAAIVGAELATPADLEREWALTGGQLEHVEPALDQLFVMRPSPALARYATPVGGLFLGSTGSHGGGGVDCAGGLLGAEALRGAGRRR